MKSSSSLAPQLWWFALVVLVAAAIGLTWANFRYAQQNPGGNDFLVHWVGTRALLVDGLSPYSDEVAVRIQTLAYGRPAQAGEHELRVAYPLYASIVFTPFALVSDYALARALWMTFLEILLITLAILALRLTSWQPSLFLLPVFILFSLAWYHAVRALINGNAVVLVAALLAGALLALRSGRDELAGILLGFATIKPHLILLLVLFIFLWAFSRGRGRVVLWTAVTVILLSLLAGLFLPDWPVQNLREILRYPAYNPPGNPAAALQTWFPANGRKIGWFISAGALGVMAVEWVAALRKEFRWFLWTACLTLVLSPWSGIQTDPGNFILLFIPLVLVFAVWRERWGPRAEWTILLNLLLVFAGLWALFLRTLQAGPQPVQSPALFFPLPAYLIILLYWVRWWAVRPVRLLIETLRVGEGL